MISATLSKRVSDDFGEGHFHASRGSRLHLGIDYAAHPGCQIHSPVRGTVTKHGYPYEDHPEYRYIEITTSDGARHRFFYVHPNPNLPVGAQVHINDYIGYAQDISVLYNTPDRKMINHVHYEILLDGQEIDPEEYHK